MFSKILAFIKVEPALITNAVSAALGIIVSFGIGLTSDQTGAILAIVGAILTVITAVSVRPVQVSAFTGLVTVAASLVASFGFHLSPDLVGSLNLLIVAVFAILTRSQVTPVVTLRRQRPVPVAPPVPSPVPPAA